MAWMLLHWTMWWLRSPLEGLPCNPTECRVPGLPDTRFSKTLNAINSCLDSQDSRSILYFYPSLVFRATLEMHTMLQKFCKSKTFSSISYIPKLIYHFCFSECFYLYDFLQSNFELIIWEMKLLSSSYSWKSWPSVFYFVCCQ